MAGVVVELTGDEAKLLRSMQKVIDQNAKMVSSFKSTGGKAKESTDTITKSFDDGLKSLVMMASGFGAVTVAVGVLSDVQQKFVGQMKEAVILTKQLASAQQEAAKNLAGNGEQSISDALLKTVPEIAKSASFSDLSKITTALGSSASIVGEDKARSAVEVSAQLTRFKKEDLQSTATSTADIMKAAQISGKEAMSLLLTAGAVARPEELPKLAGGASRAIFAGVDASPTQAPVDAAKDTAALFSVFSKVDKRGESAATATIQMIELLRETFNPNRDEKAKQDDRVAELLREQAITTEEQVTIDRALLNIQQKEEVAKRVDPKDMRVGAQDIRLDLAEAKSSLVRAQKSSGIGDKETEELRRLQLQQQLSANDPGTIRGRMEKIQQSPELLRNAEANLKAEAAFKSIAQGFFDPNSIHMKGLNAAFDSVTTNTTKFDDALKTMEITPQQKLALASERSDTANSVKNFKDVQTQTFGTVDEIVQKALKENPNTGVNAIAESLSGVLFKIVTLGQGSDEPSISSSSMSPEHAISSAILTLRDRQVDVGDFATSDTKQMSKSARDKIESLQGSIDALQQMAKSMAEQNELMQQQNKLLENGNEKVDKQTEILKDSGSGPSAPAIRAMAMQGKQ